MAKQKRAAKARTTGAAAARGAANRDRAAAASAANSRAVREIGPNPPPENRARRRRCAESLELFARTYFPKVFALPFSADHRAVIERMEECVRGGGQFACALPRGHGKSSLAQVAVLWALLYGRRRYVVLVASTAQLAVAALKRVKAEVESNDLLAADFPEACRPVRKLERIGRRAPGQTCEGVPTSIEWGRELVRLPTVAGSPCSGSVVQTAGLEGSVRGLLVRGPDGEPLRPDLAVIDDPQTRSSARSPTQTAERLQLINSDVMGLAGPTTRIAAFALVTVIYPHDLADQLLNPERHPDWKSVRTRLLASMPTRMDLWDRYIEARRLSLAEGDGGRRSDDFYREHRAEMDAGAAASWPERVKPGELSAVQSAMHLYYADPNGFHAEYQNDPQAAELAAGAKEHDAAALAARCGGTERHVVPRECTRLTAGIDCGAKLLWYVVTAWTEAGGGCVIDYGCWPRQARSHFAAADARPSLADAYPGRTESQLVYAGLIDLAAEILGRAYFREGGPDAGELRVERCLVDAGWQTQAVFQALRASPHSSVLTPSKGVGRTVTSAGVGAWKPRPGERAGYHWRQAATAGRLVSFDPDAWKSLLHERLTTPLGSPAALSLFGSSAAAHAMIGEHLAAEYSVPATLRGQTFDKWQVRPDRPENHYLDSAALSAVAASVAGLKYSATGQPVVAEERPRQRLSDVLARKREAAGGRGGGAATQQRAKLSDILAQKRRLLMRR